MQPVFFLKGRHPQKGTRIGLSAVDPDRDIDFYLKWLNDPSVRRNLFHNQPKNEMEQRQSFDRYLKDKDAIHMTIFLIEDNAPVEIGIGFIEINEVRESYSLRINEEDCHIHILNDGRQIYSINPLRRGDLLAITASIIGDSELRGKGVGSTVKLMLLDYAFSRNQYLKLIVTQAHEDNVASLSMMEKALHKRSLIRKAFIFKDNSSYNAQIMELKREDWENNIDYFRSFLD